MSTLKDYIIISALLLAASLSLFGNNEKDNKSAKDTVSALVITPKNPLYSNLSNLSGNEIIQLIDSLLELKNIPKEMLTGINEYVDNKRLEIEHPILLTNYYDNSVFPSNSTYKKWDTKQVFSYGQDLAKNDTSLLLTLTDVKNNCNFFAPIHNPVITSNFGWRNGKNHHGIDLDLQVWDPVVASFDGMVRLALYHPGYGRVVIIRHYNGLETLYAHLHRFKVKTGDIVAAGQVIGLGGNSGQSRGSHLHYEIRYKGIPLNPKHIISFKNNELISDSLKLVKNQWNYSTYPVGIEYHTIKKGDFIHKIANQYGTTVADLCRINNISRNKILVVGRKIRLN